MLMRRNLLLISFIFVVVLLTPAVIALAGTLIDDFEDGDTEGWKKSPQNEGIDSVTWELVEGAYMFDPEGTDWATAICQMNFVGVPGAENVREWTDYELEVDIKHETMQNHPGGIRTRVDLDTGGHYALWLYPANSNMKLYKNPGWDINTGLSTLGEAAYKPEVGEFHTLKMVCEGDTITVFYDGEEMISATDSEHKKGTIALCVQNQLVYYDNIKVTGPQVPNLKLSPVEPAGKLATTWGTIKDQR